MTQTHCTAAHHDALRQHSPAWEDLDLCGYQEGPLGDWYELRTCPRCGSTLAVEIDGLYLAKEGVPS